MCKLVENVMAVKLLFHLVQTGTLSQKLHFHIQPGINAFHLQNIWKTIENIRESDSFTTCLKKHYSQDKLTL